MIVNKVQVGDVDMAMSMAVNPYTPPEVTAYLEQTHREFVNKVGNFNTAFVNKVREIKNYFNNNATIRKLRSVLTRSETVISPDSLHRISTSNLHNPSLRMRGYLVANPRVFNQVRKGRLVAYNDEWAKNEMDTPAEWRREYMEVVDGIVRWENDNDEGYTEHMVGRDNRLNFEEQIIINDAWNLYEGLMAKGLDPTDTDEMYKKFIKGDENE